MLMTEHQRLRHIAQIAEAVLYEARRDWNGVAQALGPLGTGRLLALSDALDALHIHPAA